MSPLVLVVDSDPSTRQLLRGTAPLADIRFDVRSVAAEPGAAGAVAERMPDLLVVSADETDGAAWDQLISEFRRAGCAAPAIVVTRRRTIAEEQAFRLGVRDVLQKPLNAPTLRNALKSALNDFSYRQRARPIEQELSAPAPATQSTNESALPEPEATQPTTRAFDVLYAIGKSITSLVDLDEILHRVVDAAVYLTHAEQGALMLLDPERNELLIRAAKNFDEQLARTLRLRTSDSLAGQVVKSGKPVRISGQQQTKIKTAFLVRSALYVPLRIGGEIQGVLTVDNQTSPASFSSRDERALTAMADYAAIAIRNGQLVAELRSQNSALAAAVRELQEADQLKEEMIQNLSHELRTPLVFVKGFIHLLRDGEFGPLSESIQKGLDTAIRRMDDLENIVENTVALGEPEQFSLSPEPVAVQDLIRRSIRKKEPAAAKSAIAIVTDLPPLPLLVFADVRLIEHVLNNLLDNAIKFSPGGGLVTVSASLTPQREVELAVSDSGVGIPADKTSRVFERFFQVDGSATRAHGGAGLGLAAARTIVRAHGSDLLVDSHPGAGSVFRFRLSLPTKEKA